MPPSIGRAIPHGCGAFLQLQNNESICKWTPYHVY